MKKPTKSDKSRLFSELTSKKKDEIFKNTVDLVSNTLYLSKEIKDEIRKHTDLDKLIHYRKIFNELSRGQRIFTHKGFTFTINVAEMYKKMIL